MIICQLSYHYYSFKYTFIFNTSSYPYYFIPIFYIYHHYIYEYNSYHYLDIIYSFHHFPFSIQISSKSTTWSYQPIYTYPFNCTSSMVSLGHIVTVYNNTRLYHHSFSLSTFLESLQCSCQFCHLKRQFMINFKKGAYKSYHTIYWKIFDCKKQYPHQEVFTDNYIFLMIPLPKEKLIFISTNSTSLLPFSS